VLVPEPVHAELLNPLAPALVQAWAAAPPAWIGVKQVPNAPDDASLRLLGAGERAAIQLALSIHADLALIDERKGTQAALDKGLDVTGTLGILQRAALRGLLDLAEAFKSRASQRYGGVRRPRSRGAALRKLTDRATLHRPPGWKQHIRSALRHHAVHHL
jgi:hypothetical protein